MAKNLVIVESPAKAKSINKILGSDYQVVASLGHVRDLPQGKLGVDVENDFAPQYSTIKAREKILAEIRKEAGKAEAVYLAPDPDREGEAIAWHLVQALNDKIDEDRFFRVTYNEITRSAILAAFEHPTKIDMNRVNAQQARRILDRLVGFKGSPVVRKQIRGAQSVGRVQTVALRLVCERENEITNFEPEAFFAVGAEVRKQETPLDAFTVKLARINGVPVGVKDRKLLPGAVKTREQLETIRQELESNPLTVSDVATKEVTRRARPPFITSTLQQSASGALGCAPARTMRLAQKLYESGLITYMRTDSFNRAQFAVEACREFVGTSYGTEYLPESPNFYKSKRSAQEAHEAIRPTDVHVLPGREGVKLEAAEQKLYKLIWERFVASQMAPARIARRTVEVEAGSENSYLFRATSSEIMFPGYMKASGIEAAADKKNGQGEDDETKSIPPLTQGETLDVLNWLAEQKETRPVARYTEASLIRALEENGVGRPSTYAAIMSKLDEREYVTKEKSSLKPTERGRELVELVLKTEQKLKSDNKIDLFEVHFTADMETRLDDVEEGRVEWTDMIQEFYPSLLEWLEHARETADPVWVDRCFKALDAVTEWAPPVKSGRRTYDDCVTFEDLKKKVAGEGEKLSKRQGEMLHKMCCRYIKQVPEALSVELELVEPEAVRGDTLRKLELLENLEFEEPRKVGKRTYDDNKFSGSLRDQVVSGKRLSENQLKHLDRLVLKYAAQIEGFEAISKELDLTVEEQAEDTVSGPLLTLLDGVSEWKPAVKRGKREWSDQAFYESLQGQFKRKKALSDRQVAALKKMIARYAAQIPGYIDLREQYGLAEPKTPKAETPKADAPEE